MRASSTGRARTSSTSAAAPGSTCRGSPRRRARSWASSRTRPWSSGPGARVAAPADRYASCRHSAAATTLPDGERRRGPRAVGVLLRPGLRAGPGRAGPGDAARWDGVRRRQRRDPVDLRGVVPARRCRATTRRPWSGSGGGRAGSAAARHRLDLRLAGGLRGWCASSSQPLSPTRSSRRPRAHRCRLRGEPLVAALLRRPLTALVRSRRS